MKTIFVVSAMLVGVVVLAQPAGNAENGKRLFLRDGCWECHGYAGQGGRDGARLAATSLTAPQLTRDVRRPSGAMPAYIEHGLDDEELVDVWAYWSAMPAP